MNINGLAGRHRGETAWIVGKGPSLQFLNAAHFADGPIITINEAILVVQELCLQNTIYAMNKDGCHNERKGHTCPMIYPNPDVTMILQAPGFSQNCFPQHPKRMFVNPVNDLGFSHPAVMSVRMCIAIAKIMECSRIMLVCCDSLVNGDMRIYDGETVKASGASGHYLAVISKIKRDVRDIPHKYILPRNNGQQATANT